MFLLALAAPLAGLILCLLLAVAILWSATCGILYRACSPQARRPDRQTAALGEIKVSENEDSSKIFTCVRMHGLQLPKGPTGKQDGCKPGNKQQQEVLELFRTYAGSQNSNVYTTFTNPEMQVFLASGLGCLPYTVAAHWGARVVCAVGDPVCPPQHTLAVMQLFWQAFPGAVFVDLSKAAASQLAGQDGAEGLPAAVMVNDIGVETVIDAQKFDFEFNKKTKHIRRRAESAARAGLIVEELFEHSSDELKAQVKQLATEWQQGKECTDDVKVFSRAIPFDQLGRERDVRVFIARTLEPGEVVQTVAERAAALERKQQAAVKQQGLFVPAEGLGQGSKGAIPATLSRKQRKLMERVQHAKARRAVVQVHASGSVKTNSADTAAAPDQQPPAALEMVPLPVASDTPQLCDQQLQLLPQLPQLQDQQQPEPSAPSVAHPGSKGSSSSSSSNDVSISIGDGRIHACLVLDPIYCDGQVVGYLAERSFLCPRGVKGAVKLALRDVLGLLKAEGRSVLNLGLAVAYETRPGSYHGFDSCSWLARTFRLCPQYGNDLYAFRNLADAKASWGGGYNPQTDTYKYAEAVRMSRRFAAVPPSWRCQLGHGPFLMAVVFRHINALGDPWELLAFWRFWRR